MNTSLLRLFCRPEILTSIALLLVNDHILKVLAPSWLTGKISDFAGLFFFPYLLAMVLRPVFKENKRALFVAFTITGLSFTLLKTVPWINAEISSAFIQLTGKQPNLVLDPTDLLALLVLWPSWRLSTKARSNTRAQIGSRRIQYTIILLASVSAIASMPCGYDNEMRLTRVLVLDGNLYAGYPNTSEKFRVIKFSPKTAWSTVHHPQPEIEEALKITPPKLPYITCDPGRKNICYRIDGTMRIDESLDGGSTWKTGWELQPGREEVIRRLANLSCNKTPQLGFFDLAIYQTPDDLSIVIAITPNEGALMRYGDEPWKRRYVDKFSVTKEIPDDLEEAIVALHIEAPYIAIGVYASYLLLSVLAWIKSPRNSKGKKRFPAWSLHPALAAISLPLVIWFSTIFKSLYSDSLLDKFVTWVSFLGLAVFFLILLTISLISKDTRSRTRWYAFLAIACVFIIPSGTFLLWLYGIIHKHETAVLISILLTAPIYLMLFNQTIKSFHPPSTIPTER